MVTHALATKESIDHRIHLFSVPNRPNSSDQESTNDHLWQMIDDGFFSMPDKVNELIEQVNARESSDKFTCIVADQILGWPMQIAKEMGIQGATFSATAAIWFVVRSQFRSLSMTELLTVMKLFFEYAYTKNKSLQLANWALCNSTYELEHATFDTEPKIRPIGPLLASNNSLGNLRPEELTCLKWLDQQPPDSVIYVAFGTTAFLDQTKFQELAMGLELTNRPFLWVVRSDNNSSNDLLQGFKDRVGSRGLIVSWAPQQQVVQHHSIACVLFHCGWNSTLEALSNGIPLLCWSHFADQFLNEKYICNVWEVGLGFNQADGKIITREEIKNKVEELLGSEKYKANALAHKENLRNSIKQGGCSYNNLNSFVEWLQI
ncbi:hypothetical protein Q3G72_005595 [Acer saccharum]|nr:hypothetical protein Q3G72_005595 [Acer saccharum]